MGEENLSSYLQPFLKANQESAKGNLTWVPATAQQATAKALQKGKTTGEARAQQKDKQKKVVATRLQKKNPGWSVQQSTRDALNLVDLQEELYHLGMFEKGTSYKKAVDGYDGPLTQKALAKAKEMGYTLDASGKLVKSKKGHKASSQNKVSSQNKTTNQPASNKNSSNSSVLGEMASRIKASVPSNMAAVNKYMSNTTGRYTVVDKNSSNVYLYDNGKLIGQDRARLGTFKGDGYTVTTDEKDWQGKARQTGAGIFTVDEVQDMYGLPGVRLYTSSGDYTSEALHRNLNGGKDGDRKQGSGGCVRTNLIPKKAGEGWYQPGDSVIVLPEMEGNIVYYDEGDKKFKTHFTNMPQTVQHPGGYREVELSYNQTPKTVWYNPGTWF